MIHASLLVLIENPEGNADICCDEKFSWQDDNGFHFVILYQFLSDFKSICVAQCTIGQQESCNTRKWLQVRKHVKNPSIVGVALRRCIVVCPTRVILQVIIIPTFQVERRIGHDIVEIQSLMQVVGESGIAFRTQIMTDATQSEVHLCQTIGGSLLLLSIDIDTTDVTLLGSYQISTLNEHTTRATTRIIKSAVERLYDGSNQLHYIVRRIKLALLFRGINGKLFQEVLIHTAYQVFLFTKSFVAYLVDLVHNLLHVIGSKIALGECTFHKTTFQRRIRFSYAAQSSIQSYIQLWSSRIDDG